MHSGNPDPNETNRVGPIDPESQKLKHIGLLQSSNFASQLEKYQKNFLWKMTTFDLSKMIFSLFCPLLLVNKLEHLQFNKI
jgi:hypothetical protein